MRTLEVLKTVGVIKCLVNIVKTKSIKALNTLFNLQLNKSQNKFRFLVVVVVIVK